MRSWSSLCINAHTAIWYNLRCFTQDILLRNLNVAYLLQVKGEWDCSHCGGSMALVRDKGRNAEY